jgi:redox-sensitive bicupin YhaK (pirin superfamily)
MMRGMNTLFTPSVTGLVREPRALESVVLGRPTRDGAGVRLTRVLTQDLQARLDPFLMLDQFGSDDPRDYRAGFPDHPHRGFETVTYMIAGRMRHRDSHGGEGVLQAGGVQWMTAGRGVIHSEMPEQQEGRMEGFQLWLNLPSRQKMCPPSYRDIPGDQIPQFTCPQGVQVRVIAGCSHGVTGAVARPAEQWPTDPLYLDLHFDALQTFTQPLPSAHNAFVYVYRGQLDVPGTQGADRVLASERMGILSQQGDGVMLQGKAGTRALLIAGRPLGEPIAQYGPFVMNTQEQLLQAIHDYQKGAFGL